MPNAQSCIAEKKLEDLSTKLEAIEKRIARNEHLSRRHNEAAGRTRTTAKQAKHTVLAMHYADRLAPLVMRAKRLRGTIKTVRHNLATATRMDNDAAERSAPAIMRAAIEQAQAQAEANTVARLSPKEARKRLKAMEHEANRKERVARTRRQRFTAAGIDPDNRLATATRDIDVTGIGKDTKGYVSGIASVLRNKSERLPSRIAAWDRFDSVCDAAFAGLVGAPRYEPAIQTSHSPDMPIARLEAGQVMTLLGRWVGADGWGLLFHVVYLRQSIAELCGKDMGARYDVAARFRAALDGAASFWGFSDDVAVGREARRILMYFDDEARAARPGSSPPRCSSTG